MSTQKIESPDKVLALTSPDGLLVMECYDLWTFRFMGYLKAFDPEFRKGAGGCELTRHIDEALRFKDFMAATQCWKMTSEVRPKRGDGKPNRPLTHYTIQIAMAHHANQTSSGGPESF